MHWIEKLFSDFEFIENTLDFKNIKPFKATNVNNVEAEIIDENFTKKIPALKQRNQEESKKIKKLYAEYCENINFFIKSNSNTKDIFEFNAENFDSIAMGNLEFKISAMSKNCFYPRNVILKHDKVLNKYCVKHLYLTNNKKNNITLSKYKRSEGFDYSVLFIEGTNVMEVIAEERNSTFKFELEDSRGILCNILKDLDTSEKIENFFKKLLNEEAFLPEEKDMYRLLYDLDISNEVFHQKINTIEKITSLNDTYTEKNKL